MTACFIASYNISKPIASLCFLVPSCIIFGHLFLFALSPSHVFASSICLMTRSSSFRLCVCLSLLFFFFFFLYYFLPLLSVCASTAKCYAFLLFSVCLCVLGPVLSPQLGLQMDHLSKETHNHLQTSLFNQLQLIYSFHFCRLLLAKWHLIANMQYMSMFYCSLLPYHVSHHSSILFIWFQEILFVLVFFFYT